MGSLRWPTPSMAQQANMSTEAFEKFYFDVCCLDYKNMDEAMKPLEKLMNNTDKVHIKGPGTDLDFRLKTFQLSDVQGKEIFRMENVLLLQSKIQ